MGGESRQVTGIPAAVIDWIAANRAGSVVAAAPVAGGCIHSGRRLETGAGYTFFLKSNRGVPADMFPAEAHGLALLAGTGCIRIPAVLAHGPDFLLLEDLSPAAARQDYWTLLGRRLACLHGHTADRCGLDQDNYLGSTPQPNTRTEDGFAFFADHRLRYQAELAGRRGLLSAGEVGRVDRLAARLREWIPEQPASLIHGDLWSGNLLADSKGEPALIDPAAHYGWGEADLAMMVLFGPVPEGFFEAYREVRPLEEGVGARFPIYNLYHLLNHLNIFGRSYLGQVRAVLDRFVGL